MISAKQEARTQKNLVSVHFDLAKVFVIARKNYERNFPNVQVVITSEPRTEAMQRHLVDIGASQTMNSRHRINKTGKVYAIDVVFITMMPNEKGIMKEVARYDWPMLKVFADYMKNAGKLCNVPIEWGGDWKKFKDGPHFQLPWKQYPA